MNKRRSQIITEGKTSFTRKEKLYLGYYVYRLVDPRNGQTFYVGKGTGNRVFDHMKGLPPEEWEGDTRSEDELPTKKNAKIDTINAIHHDGLHVTCFIHRHDMDENVAYEVEAALIDAYGALTNIQKGRGYRTQGCMSIEQVEAKANSEEADFGKKRFVIIKVRPETVAAHNGDVYKAVCGNWVVNLSKVKNLPVIACVEGTIQAVYDHCEWSKANKTSGKQRYFFTGKKSKQLTEKFKGKRIPTKYRRKSQANPIRYVNV